MQISRGHNGVFMYRVLYIVACIYICVCNIKAYTAGQTQSGVAAAQLGLRRLMSGLVCVILVDYTHIYTHTHTHPYFVAKYISPFYSSIHFNFLVSECPLMAICLPFS